MAKSTTIELGEAAGVSRVGQLHAAARDALENGSDISFDCESTRDLDTSILQLMMATQVAADQHGSRVALDNVTDYVESLLENLGVMYLLGHDASHG